MKALYRGTYLRNGGLVMPGLAPGGEYDWMRGIGKQSTQAAPGGGAKFYRYLVYGDPDWDFTKFDIDRDLGANRTRLFMMPGATHCACL